MISLVFLAASFLNFPVWIFYLQQQFYLVPGLRDRFNLVQTYQRTRMLTLGNCAEAHGFILMFLQTSMCESSSMGRAGKLTHLVKVWEGLRSPLIKRQRLIAGFLRESRMCFVPILHHDLHTFTHALKRTQFIHRCETRQEETWTEGMR